MTKTRDVLAVFNRGRISRLAVARTDVSRIALSAETQTNFIPRKLGSMMLRPGLEYIGTTENKDGALIPFVFTNDDTAIVEVVASEMFVWDDGTSRVSYSAVTAAVANGSFDADLTSWTDGDETGATSSWATGGYLQLLGTGGSAAKRSQAVTVDSSETGTVHGLRIFVERGPVLLRVGSTSGGDDIFPQAVLRTGKHSIRFTPGVTTFHIEFSSSLQYPVLVDQCEIESAGDLSLPVPYTGSLPQTVRWFQSADVLFLACDGVAPYRIERRENNSWSIVKFEPTDGPFLTENTDDRFTITPSALSGEITLTSNRSLFQSGHVGALFRLTSNGQLVEEDISAENSWTNSIRVTGVGENREFTIKRAGVWNGTVSLQRSVGEEGSWATVRTWTTNNAAGGTYDDDLDNQIVYYRMGFDADDYASGTAELTMDYANGAITGAARVTEFTSDTSVTAVVVKTLGGTDATGIWAEGAWSDVQAWPQAVALWEGRLWWSGEGRNWASASDALETYDPDVTGDSAPINRRSGEGAVATSHWMLPLQRLVVGTDVAEQVVQSTSFDEPVTPSNYNVKAPSTKGSAAVPAGHLDDAGYFVDRTTKRLFELRYDTAQYRFVPLEVSGLVPEIGDETFSRLAVQQSPDMRVHVVRDDGTVALLVRDSTEDVLAWVDVETDGVVEDVVVLPGDTEDRVFYRVKRTIEGTDVRYLERWALETAARGGTLNKQADSFVTGTGIVDGLDHIEGESVVIWADGADQGTHTVTDGVADATSYTSWCAGLTYRARYKSAKLAGQTALGLHLTERSRIDHIGLILADTHAQGLQYGPSFTTMDSLPLIENAGSVDTTSTWTEYAEDMIVFPGEWNTDNRVCLEANAPKPCTVLAAVLSIDRQDKA